MRMKGMLDEVLSQHGIVTIQFGMLSLLHRTGPLSQIEIGGQMNIDKASVVKFIDGLEKRDLVKRVGNKKDRRVKSIVITHKGVLLFKKGVILRNKAEKVFLKPLTKHEQKIIMAALPKVLK